MERNFTDEDFEDFLRQNADGLRMRPSDKVWQGISQHIDQRRRRTGIILGASLLLTASLGYYLTNPTGKKDNMGVAADAPAATAKVVTMPSRNETRTLASTPAANTSGNNASTPGNSATENTVVSAGRPVRATAVHFNLNRRAAQPHNQSEVVKSTVSESTVSENTLQSLNETQNEFTGTVIDDSYPLTGTVATNTPLPHTAATDPLTIESVLNSYRRKHSKPEVQVYFTPSVSYRQLSENKAYIKSMSPANIPSSQQSLYDINSMVTHKPDFGFEVGMAAKYPVTKNIKLRAGIQFNVNRYDIKVFNSSTQFATIMLSDRNRIDSMRTTTNYNNFSGYKTNWLENFYFQVSAPIGVELKLKEDDKVEFGIASTIQPTYVLGDRAYLLSYDYKNYAEVPWLIRRWNVNTNLETFVSYSTGHLKWQVGPQVRYQLLSSFVKKYPVKENLFDFGLKVGLSLNNKQ